MYGYIYITTNLINNKKYIGQHTASRFSTFYKGSGTLLRKAFDKYGKKNFECHILESINNVPTICDSDEQLNESEKYYINYYNCVNDSNYYNIVEGGRNAGYEYRVQRSQRCKNKLGPNKNTKWVKNNKEQHLVPLDKYDYYLQNGYKPGKFKLTDLTRQRQCEAKKDLIPITDETKTIYINKNDLNKYIKLGFRPGRKPDGRAPNKDTRWVHDEFKSYMVPKDDFTDYINAGFIKGRGSIGPQKKHRDGSPTKGRIRVIKDNITKYASIDELSFYKEDNWFIVNKKYR